MVPTSYTELFIFLVGAVGAALLLGTGAALLRFRRTGAFPGEHTTAGLVRSAMVKCALGAVVLVASVGMLLTVRS